MGYLLVISFLLHFTTLFIIIVLVQKINAIKPSTNTNEQEKIKREIEDLLVAYTAEMKEENEKLINKIIQKRKVLENAEQRTVQLYENIKPKAETKKVDFKPDRQMLNEIMKDADEDEQTFAPPMIAENEDVVEKSTTAEILSLRNQGYSVKEIAKMLNIGDGEVELLLKFHK